MKKVHSPKYLKNTLLRLRNPNFFLMGHVIKEKHISNRVGGSSGKLYFTKQDLLFSAVNQPYAALDEVKTHLKSISHTIWYVLVLHVNISLNRLISQYTDDLQVYNSFCQDTLRKKADFVLYSKKKKYIQLRRCLKSPKIGKCCKCFIDSVPDSCIESSRVQQCDDRSKRTSDSVVLKLFSFECYLKKLRQLDNRRNNQVIERLQNAYTKITVQFD